MITKFTIYKKSGKFYWSVNKIYYSALFFVLGLGYILQEIFKTNYLFFQWSAIIIMMVGIFYKIKGLMQIEPLRGILEGDLIFEKESITMNNKSYSLNEINKIQINNDDYIGKRINISKGNIGPVKSNGTNNSVVLLLKSEENKKCQFELINSNDFQNIRTILIEYHVKEKIDFWELANVLGAKNNSEIKNLKEEIETNQSIGASVPLVNTI